MRGFIFLSMILFGALFYFAPPCFGIVLHIFAHSKASNSVQLSLFGRSMHGSDILEEAHLDDELLKSKLKFVMARLLVLILGILEKRRLMKMRPKLCFFLWAPGGPRALSHWSMAKKKRV